MNHTTGGAEETYFGDKTITC